MKIALTGASGQLGRLVLARLKARALTDSIVALMRSPDKERDLGVDARAFDYTERGGLAPALAGVETLLLISSNQIGQRAIQHRNVIEAAGQAGVGRIVYTSLLHADVSTIDLAAEHLDTETALAASGISATILRNGWYTENYTGSLAGALAAGACIGSAGAARISSAARADYAEAAAVALTEAGHGGKTYELAGDTAWTLPELAAELSRQVGRDIPYRDLSAVDYAATLTNHGVPESLARAIAGWDVAASHGALFDDSRQLSALIGRRTTPLAASIAAAIA